MISNDRSPETRTVPVVMRSVRFVTRSTMTSPLMPWGFTTRPTSSIANRRCRRLRSLLQPGDRLLVVDLDAGRLEPRLIGAQDLDEPPVAGRPSVGRDQPIRRLLLLSHPHQAELHCHLLISRCAFGRVTRPPFL